jgi:hypothetical protein
MLSGFFQVSSSFTNHFVKSPRLKSALGLEITIRISERAARACSFKSAPIGGSLYRAASGSAHSTMQIPHIFSTRRISFWRTLPGFTRNKGFRSEGFMPRPPQERGGQESGEANDQLIAYSVYSRYVLVRAGSRLAFCRFLLGYFFEIFAQGTADDVRDLQVLFVGNRLEPGSGCGFHAYGHLLL